MSASCDGAADALRQAVGNADASDEVVLATTSWG